MASQTLQSIRDYVRSYMDLDESDLADTLIDAWCSEGSLLIEKAEKRWPFYETSWTLSTVADQQDYTITTAIGTNVREVVAITGPRWDLLWIDRGAADWRWPQNVETTGEPTHWSQWGTTSLRLHPTPSAAVQLTVRGYRTATDWVATGAGTSPDFPAELHPTLMAFVMARAYLQQEDEDLAQQNMQIFEASLDAFRRRITDTPGNQPLILNSRRSHYSPFLGSRLRFPWES